MLAEFRQYAIGHAFRRSRRIHRGPVIDRDQWTVLNRRSIQLESQIDAADPQPGHLCNRVSHDCRWLRSLLLENHESTSFFRSFLCGMLHFDDLPASEVEEREGYRLTCPIRTIVDVSNQREVSGESLSTAFTEARVRGLVTGQDIELYRDRLPAFLLTSRKRLVKAA